VKPTARTAREEKAVRRRVVFILSSAPSRAGVEGCPVRGWRSHRLQVSPVSWLGGITSAQPSRSAARFVRATLLGRGDERIAAVVCGLTKQVQSQSDLAQLRSQSDRLPPYSRAAATAFLERRSKSAVTAFAKSNLPVQPL
jgi:hypothetical protein